jgi:hypothetical protein
VTIQSNISCGSEAKDDCKGMLFIGVIDKPASPPESKTLGSFVVNDVDLKSKQSVSYSITNLPAEGAYIAAMLVETGTPSGIPTPKPGDLIVEPTQLQLQKSKTTSSL